MLFVYKIGAIRVTPKFTRIVVGATIGVFGLMLVNLVAYLFTPGGLGLRTGGPLAVIFSLICIVIAAMNLVMDFDFIERGIRQGAPAEARLVRRVRADRHADLALHRDPAPARLRPALSAAPPSAHRRCTYERAGRLRPALVRSPRPARRFPPQRSPVR